MRGSALIERRSLHALRWYLLAALVGLYWLVCFAPYRWVSPVSYVLNDAVRLGPDANGLRFSGQGIAQLPIPPGINFQGDLRQLRLVLTAQCGEASQSGPARLMTLSNSPFERNLMLGQDGADLVVRLRREGSNANGMPDFRVAGFFRACVEQTLELDLDPERLILRADGETVLLSGPLRLDWQQRFPIWFGNEGSWDRGWRGDLRNLRLEANGTMLAESFATATLPAGAWLLSDRAQVAHGFTLVPFSRPKPLLSLDNQLNVLGFLPFGLLLAWGWAGRLNVLTAGALAALLSGSIELGQIGFAGRFPSTTDLCTNTLGGILGFVAGGWIRWGGDNGRDRSGQT